MAADSDRSKYVIHIDSLQTPARIGVLAEEKEAPQAIELDVTLYCIAGWSGLGDDLQATVDYAAVAEFVRRLAMEKHRNLIETLAAHLCRQLLGFHPVITEVEVELRKFILPGTDHVAVRWREANPDQSQTS